MLPPARKRPRRGAGGRSRKLIELEGEAQSEHDEHVDCIVLARDQLAQRVGARPRSSQSLVETAGVARGQDMLERREVLGALVLRPGAGQRSGPGWIRQPPGDEQVDGTRELLLTRDLLRRRPAQRTQRNDVCEHLLRRPAARQPAQERKQVLQIEAGEEQVDELAIRSS